MGFIEKRIRPAFSKSTQDAQNSVPIVLFSARGLRYMKKRINPSDAWILKHFVNPAENCWSNEKFFVQKKGCKNFLPKKTLVFQKIQKNPKHMGQKTMIRWDFIVFSVIFGPKIELVVIRGNSRVDFSNSWLVNSRVNSRVHELRGHTGIMRY